MQWSAYNLWREMREADKIAEKRAKDPAFDWIVSASDFALFLFVVLAFGLLIVGCLVGVVRVAQRYL